MKLIDIFLNLLIPTLVLVHLLVAPYTKVEESFNIQAIHDIANYGLPTRDVYNQLQRNYDHFEFPGAVPRTFVGALALASISNPIISLVGARHAQFIVRAVLGLFNAVALLRYKDGLAKAFGKSVGRWYILLQATQFHVVYYASRTLPNMFAFGLVTLAMREFLPIAPASDKILRKKQKLAIFLLVFSGVVFRSEIALLLFSQLICLLVQSKTSLKLIVPTGIKSTLVSLAVSIPIDSYFWQKPIWPEFAGFYYNAIEGKSVDWGISSFHYYFSALLPRLLHNPLILVLFIPVAFVLPSTKYPVRDLVIPSILFIAIYSLQPHKESRFIIYVVPPLTGAASLAASYIWTRKSKSVLYFIGSLLLGVSVIGSLAASNVMLLISSLNYPGGEALAQLHKIINRTEWLESPLPNEYVHIHMDVLSCMTGVTRFKELPWRHMQPPNLPVLGDRQTLIYYDKTEELEQLLRPDFWAQFDYLLMEDPSKAIGDWEVVKTVYGYDGIEFLRPGDGSSFGENMERVFAANNITEEEEDRNVVTPGSENVTEAFQDDLVLYSAVKEEEEENFDLRRLKARLLLEELGKFGGYKLIRDAVRQVTRGWWIGPRMEPKIRILKQVKGPAV